MNNQKLSKKEKEYILSSIRDIKDFPKKGIIFKDITTLLNNSRSFNIVMTHLENRYKDAKLDYIIGLDARGFIFGAVLADRLNIGFVPIRKRGKLPGDTICQKYELEYGHDELEIHKDAFNNKKNAKVIIVDDLCATGGTACASIELIKKLDVNLVEVCFIISLTFLNGKQNIQKLTHVYSLLDI